ncbi:MAG: hypothetical protein WA485_24290 [Candidatus Sulfotelmatobacter sp.]
MSATGKQDFLRMIRSSAIGKAASELRLILRGGRVLMCCHGNGATNKELRRAAHSQEMFAADEHSSSADGKAAVIRR